MTATPRDYTLALAELDALDSRIVGVEGNIRVIMDDGRDPPAELEAKVAEIVAAREQRAQAAAETEVRLAYRRQREAAYIAEMGAEPGPFHRVVGDVLDEVLGWIEAQDGAVATDGMTALLAKRADIKRRFPRGDG